MDEFIGSIMLWPLDYAPQGWLLCNGQMLNLRQYQALYSLLGTKYGGDGVNTFALPDLRSRVPIGAGQGAGLENYNLAQKGGAERVTLDVNQMPVHNHSMGVVSASMPASANPGTTDTPGSNAVPARAPDFLSQGYPDLTIYGAADGNTTLPVNVTLQGQTSIAGGGQSHENRQPYLVLNYIICMEGVYPVKP